MGISLGYTIHPTILQIFLHQTLSLFFFPPQVQLEKHSSLAGTKGQPLTQGPCAEWHKR